MLVQAAVSTLDGHYVGWLGGDALAAVSLVFPLVMLMQTMSAGGVGGGVAAAVARALGAGRRAEADALAAHALWIAVAMGGAFTALMLALGPSLYTALGGEGAVRELALSYSRVVFGGALAFWSLNVLASVLRGTGQMGLPAAVTLGAGLGYLGLAPVLVLGWGPLPGLGVAGAGAAQVLALGAGALVLAAYLASGRGLVRLRAAGFAPRPALFAEILRVGAPGALNTLLTSATVLGVTALVGRFGAPALAGYGMGARLEYLQIPLVFGLGSALVTMVGTNVGAGKLARAERVAWVGAAFAAGLTGAIGLVAACAPGAWMGLFTAEPAIVAVGERYLELVGPVYGCFGLGLALYFASQGRGRLGWPLAAGALRLVVAVTGGWLAAGWLEAGPGGVFAALALALVLFGGLQAAALRLGAWR
jgi:putative MATE family efflux protein